MTRPPLRLGVHAGYYGGATEPGDLPVDSMRALWRGVEAAGFDWISVWDHFFDPDAAEPGYCFDAVSMQAALACTTERVRCGVLVYCAAYRHPAVLASAIATIDHLSGGRAEIGLGAGWSRGEFDAMGVPFLPFAERMAMLGETADCVRALLTGEPTTFAGEHHRLDGARCYPRPLQDRVPIWIGGRSVMAARRAAAHADGLNLPYVPVAAVAERRLQLDEWCAEAGRPAGAVRIAVNLAIALDADDAARQFGNVGDHVRGGIVIGDAATIADVVTDLAEHGADQVNLTVRAPFAPRLLDDLGTIAALVHGRVGASPVAGGPLG